MRPPTHAGRPCGRQLHRRAFQRRPSNRAPAGPASTVSRAAAAPVHQLCSRPHRCGMCLEEVPHTSAYWNCGTRLLWIISQKWRMLVPPRSSLRGGRAQHASTTRQPAANGQVVEQMAGSKLISDMGGARQPRQQGTHRGMTRLSCRRRPARALPVHLCTHQLAYPAQAPMLRWPGLRARHRPPPEHHWVSKVGFVAHLLCVHPDQALQWPKGAAAM